MKNIYKWLILSLIIVLITSNKETFVKVRSTGKLLKSKISIKKFKIKPLWV